MKRQWRRDELADHWTFGPKELELLANKSGSTRLGFAVLLKAVALMAAELGFAAWDTQANKLWSTFIEPPWGYRIEDETITLDVMGTISQFSLRAGPPPRS